MAYKRLSALWKKFERNLDFKEQYTQAIADFIKDGHLERIPSNEVELPDKMSFYLPHHGVVKPSSATTKLRVVFDAGARSSTQVSLNNLLMIGPDLQQDLFTILVRWRYWMIPLKCDVKQMYLYILLHPAYRDFLRILWKDSKSGLVKVFRTKKVPFGIPSAPYLAKKTIQRLAKDEEKNFPRGAEVLRLDFHMDDGMTGVNSTKAAINLYKELHSITSSGKFLLRKWSSSNPKVLEVIPEELRATQLTLSMDNNPAESALGLQWIPGTYDFKFTVTRCSRDATTKRKILSEIAKVFDPLGFLSPVTIRAKFLRQKLWKTNTA
ncbi:unnamed protein product [Allacma fusca]|uniref:Reverse transcriptase domain-containing protein n=1 Tax=Allacma fusca TaxID=39272 RepID=A0A8J2KQ32_9HEXA|nr:unnamed protein product [Allacma fusca]